MHLSSLSKSITKTGKNKFSTHKYLLIVLTIYFITHLLNLTVIPIFNDESIYLDWAWFHTHALGHLFDSLLDAKQPLIIWVFGIFLRIFPDPLFAGRFASVLIGSLTLGGIYTISKKLFEEKVAFLASIIFITAPLFIFFNRQALLESAVACVSVWLFYIVLILIEKPTTKSAILLGFVFGVSLFIKATGTIYILISLLIILSVYLKTRKIAYLKSLFITLGTWIAVDAIIFINPVFWSQLPTNSRYALTISEIISFPINNWLSNLSGFLEIGVMFVTPLIFFGSIIGLILISKNRKRNQKLFLVYFITALIIEILVTRTQGIRYLMPFLPFLSISAGYLVYLFWKRGLLAKGVVVVYLAFSSILSIWLIYDPKNYIIQMARISKYSPTYYYYGQTSGIGVNEVVKYIGENASNVTPSMVFIALNIGNPESAIDLYCAILHFLQFLPTVHLQ